MRKTTLIVLCLFALSLYPVWASDGRRPFSKGSIFVTGQLGITTMAGTDDPRDKPFDGSPFPLGAGFEFMASEHIGLGCSLMGEHWSDYRGMYGGKWTFRLLRPSFDCAYHFLPERGRGLSFVVGAQCGYTFLDVGNELGNIYEGSLKSGIHLAPLAGVQINPWPGSSGFLGRLALTLKAAYPVTGTFSDVYGIAGLTYRLK